MSWARRDVRLPGSAFGSVPTLGGAREPDRRSGWDGTKLVPTRRIESANECDSTLRKDKGPRANSAQFQRSTAMQDGGESEKVPSKCTRKSET